MKTYVCSICGESQNYAFRKPKICLFCCAINVKTYVCSVCGGSRYYTSQKPTGCSFCAANKIISDAQEFANEVNQKHIEEGVELNTEWIRQRKLEERHYNLKIRFLSKEHIPEEDLLWKINFYIELIIEGLCHYCLGPLSPCGIGLDRVNNELGHLCYNVVPCCGSCNALKRDYYSYKEMMLLSPALREIRRLRATSKEPEIL
jgi:hypothetical protein